MLGKVGGNDRVGEDLFRFTQDVLDPEVYLGGERGGLGGVR
jgi:hypothetical protein